MDYFYFLPFGFFNTKHITFAKKKIKNIFPYIFKKQIHSEGKTLEVFTYTSKHTLQGN